MQDEKFFHLPGLQHEVDRLRKLLAVSGDSDHVLIQGPRGSGKSYFAQVFKEHYPEQKDPYKVNCAAIHPSLMASELFGHAKGAFTGANKDQDGIIETAHKNNQPLLLEEFNSLAREHQAQLLVYMETGNILRVGSREPIKAPVRIIATMNFETKSRVRKDIKDRFKIIVNVPPLHERREDIFVFIAEKYPNVAMDKIELLSLYAHNWPGNLRELDRVLLEMKAGIELPTKILSNGVNGQYNIQDSLIKAGFSEERLIKLGNNSFRQVIPWGYNELGLHPPYCNSNISKTRDKISLKKDTKEKIVVEIKNISGKKHSSTPEIFSLYFILIYEDKLKDFFIKEGATKNLSFTCKDMAFFSLIYGWGYFLEKEKNLFHMVNGKTKIIPEATAVTEKHVIDFILKLGSFSEVERFLYTECARKKGTQEALAKHWGVNIRTLQSRFKRIGITKTAIKN